MLSIARSSLGASSAAETGHQHFSYPTTRCLPTVQAGAARQTGPMNAERAAFLDALARAIDAGDEEARVIFPTFRPWLVELLRDPEAAKHEPGSAGHVARMFALRELGEAAG